MLGSREKGGKGETKRGKKTGKVVKPATLMSPLWAKCPVLAAPWGSPVRQSPLLYLDKPQPNSWAGFREGALLYLSREATE